MRLIVQQGRAPRWIVPAFFLLALALIPIAITLAIVVAGAVLVGTLVRAILPGPGRGIPDGRDGSRRPFEDPRGMPIIDADYQVKEENEKIEDL